MPADAGSNAPDIPHVSVPNMTLSCDAGKEIMGPAGFVARFAMSASRITSRTALTVPGQWLDADRAYIWSRN
jgi:hypothetical protein